MYSAPPQYVGSTSGLLPAGVPADTSTSIAMQAYLHNQTSYPSQQQHQGSYLSNNGNNIYSTPSFDSSNVVASHKEPEDGVPKRAYYPRLRPKTLLIRFLPILVVNIILEALFAYVLKFYGDKKVLMPNDRRLFNMASLLLAAALSMGIGFLLGEVGVMFRGSMMGKSHNTKEEIAHILRGTLGSYALLVLSHIRRKAYTHATTLSWLFVLGNLLGRLSVGLIGLTYAVEDDNVVTVAALQGTWWPEVGDAMRNESIFVERPLTEDTLVDLLREVATVRVPFSGKVKIDLDDKGDGVIEDLSFLDVTGLDISVENPEENTSTVKYSYVLQDEGGDPAIRVKRSIEVSTQCTRGKADFSAKNFSSTRFYPTSPEKSIFVGTQLDATRYGWLFHSHPGDGHDCGANCRSFGIEEGSNNEEGLVNTRWGRSGVGYICQVSVSYTSPAGWGSRPHVAPGDKLLLTFSEFFVGNGKHHDRLSDGSQFNDSQIATENANWLAPWGEIDLRTHAYPQAAGMAGVLARGLALVIQRLGDNLDKREIERSKIIIAGVLSVNWTWVIAVLAGICVVQLLVATVAGLLMLGSLEVEDNLDMLDGLIASERFPGLHEDSLVPDKPWVKKPVVKGELSYRFKGGEWGKLKDGMSKPN
ncbi:hypothetical protein BGX38DRAFT_1204134 [Terfezia claveryi]|nr:hypothetical protein BGX38DRAFT_1204134 [Terfezia claveryi]